MQDNIRQILLVLFSNLLIELNCLLQRYRLLKRKTLESHLKKAS